MCTEKVTAPKHHEQQPRIKKLHQPQQRALYIHRESNHPPSIIKNLPENISKRLSAISSNEQVFNNAAKEYQAALENSGYKDKLKYRPNKTTPTTKTQRKNERGKEISLGLTPLTAKT